MVISNDWKGKVARVFNTKPRIGLDKDSYWLEREHTMKRVDETFTRPGAQICLDGPSGVGKTSLIITYLFSSKIPHAAIQVTNNMNWTQFCRLLISDKKNNEISLSSEIELGIENALPLAKFRVSLGSRDRPSDDLLYLHQIASIMTEQDIINKLSEMDATLYIDDLERANDDLLSHISDLCKVLTQRQVSKNAKLILVGSGDIYKRLYNRNQSVDERLIQVSLGSFRYSADSWRFLARGFEKLGLRHPGNSAFHEQKSRQEECARAIWEAADGLPKSLNNLGYNIALRAQNRKAVSASDIITEANETIERRWVEFGPLFGPVINFLKRSHIAVLLLGYIYRNGIARTHHLGEVYRVVSYEENKAGRLCNILDLEDTINELTRLGFLYRTGKTGEIVFTRHPNAAHTFGAVMRNPLRYNFVLPTTEIDGKEIMIPRQEEESFISYDEEPNWEV